MCWKACGKSDWVSQIPPAALDFGTAALLVSTALNDLFFMEASMDGSSIDASLMSILNLLAVPFFGDGDFTQGWTTGLDGSLLHLLIKCFLPSMISSLVKVDK